ncbi:MAG: molybdopterin-guanine dinucleotide biosynthesis protein MobB [Candidatus Fermentibacteraceae bacterium]|nr:molybdopterin-guanine dinucleotide biosynthesis protein MobB [Candidatus Fermentibacteraceae bacterium]
MRNIVVAAAGRKLGKTLLCAELVRMLHDNGYSVAYCKLARHGSAGIEILRGPGRNNSDTWRIHAAGASEVCILKYGSLSDIEGKLPFPGSKHDVAVWETNSAASLFIDSTLIYVEGKLPHPKNPELSDVADVLVTGPLESVPQEIAGLALSVAGLPGFNPVHPGWKLWLESGGNPVFGRGVASLLEAIRDSGSILSASKAAGIQYRRVWTLVSNTENKLGMKLIRRNRGGSGGGGSSLTPVATMLLKKYHFLEKAMADAAKHLEERN